MSDKKKEPTACLSLTEKDRYSRHLLLTEVGMEGQIKLKQAKVLIVGVGGLGAPAALYLAAAGIGTLGLVDFDRVERSNLQRQVLYAEAMVGQLKVVAARERLLALNPHLKVAIHSQRLTADLATQLIPDYDVILDGTDNFATRYLLSDVCVWHKKPCVHGSIYQFEGQATLFHPGVGPCYRCLFPVPPPPEAAPNCAEAGVLGILPGQIGLIQATETLKLLLGLGTSLAGRLLQFDALKMAYHEIRIPVDPDCHVCGENPKIFKPVDYESFCGSRDKTTESAVEQVEVAIYQKMHLQGRAPLLIDVRNPKEWEICRIPQGKLLPMDKINEWMPTLDSETPLVVTCRSGARSARVVAKLKESGFSQVLNLKGGVLAWLEAFDPSQPRY